MTQSAQPVSSPYAVFKATPQPPSRTEVGLSYFEKIMDLLEHGHSQVLTQKQLITLKKTIDDNLTRIESNALDALVADPNCPF